MAASASLLASIIRLQTCQQATIFDILANDFGIVDVVQQF
jgi:hypothetical protein